VRTGTALLAIALGLLSSAAEAQPREAGEGEVAAKGSLYADDDATTVVTALADAEVGLPARARIGAHALVDVISTASVDVVSAATPSFDEVRIELGARTGMYVTPDVNLGASFVHSQENDWQSFTPAGSLAVDLLKKNVNLDVGYGFSHNRVGRAQDPNFLEQLQTHSAELGVSQVIDRRSLLALRYTFVASLGYQSSPYRYVTTRDGMFSTIETHPDQRLRHALTTSGLRYLTRGIGVEASYRFYGDDWGVLSHTTSAGFRFEPLESLQIRVRGRFYYQVASDFWRESYQDALSYMSLDRELSTFWDTGGGVKVGWHSEHWRVDAKIDGLYYRFLDFARLDGRVALVTDIGAGVQW
jgi:hypothetical protein